MPMISTKTRVQQRNYNMNYEWTTNLVPFKQQLSIIIQIFIFIISAHKETTTIIDKFNSSLIRKHYEELVDALTSSKPARESLAIKLFAKKVLCDSEKQEIMNDSGSAMSLADKLVGYILSRIDSQEHCDNIWKGLDCVEALKDILRKFESERGKLSYNTLKKRI